MQSTHETFTGVVLRDTVYKDADKILTILAKGKGIITAKARGAMKTGNPLAVGCQCFCYGEFTTYEYGGKLLVEKADAIDQFEGLRSDLSSFALAGYIAELTEQFGITDTPEDESLYRLVLNTLYALAYKPDIRRAKIKAAFELRLCSDCGFMPDLDGCMVCGSQTPVDPVFALESSQVFCKNCFDGDEATFPLTPRLLEAMRVVTSGELKKLLSFRLNALEGDIFCRLCEEYILLQIDPPESLKYYHSVRE